MQLRKWTTSLASLLILLAACTDRPTSIAAPDGIRAIVNGEPTGSAYGNVGALLFDYGNNGISGDDEWCTGSLIAPTIFLTAAHCVVSSYTPVRERPLFDNGELHHGNRLRLRSAIRARSGEASRSRTRIPA